MNICKLVTSQHNLIPSRTVVVVSFFVYQGKEEKKRLKYKKKRKEKKFSCPISSNMFPEHIDMYTVKRERVYSFPTHTRYFVFCITTAEYSTFAQLSFLCSLTLYVLVYLGFTAASARIKYMCYNNSIKSTHTMYVREPLYMIKRGVMILCCY
jgi:hypothetical protein